jgi:hypothetical protein
MVGRGLAWGMEVWGGVEKGLVLLVIVRCLRKVNTTGDSIIQAGNWDCGVKGN